MAQHILVVDDEPAVTDLLAYNLRKANYRVSVAGDGGMALRLVTQEPPDLIVLDLMLPQISGLDVCHAVRRTSQVPIIILTARDDEIDRVLGLELGADDYVCKPFSVRELLARIKVVLRRAQPQAADHAGQLTGPGALRLDCGGRLATVGGAPVPLTRLEFDVLALLLGQRGRVFSREQLIAHVWGYDSSGDTRVVDSVVKRLRAKLRALDPQADCLAAVRGIGYKAAQEGAP